MRTVAVVQARMGSTRLPGKAMLDICGKPMLGRVLERLRRCKMLDGIVVATPDTPESEPILAYCNERGADFFRGAEADVLGRYYAAAVAYSVDHVVRVTSDCPLVEPHVVDAVVRMFREDASLHYCCNNLKATWPHGLDCEIFTLDALRRANRETINPAWREGVNEPFRLQPAKYRLGNLECPEDLSSYRLTVDWQEDLDMMREIYKALGPEPHWKDVQWLIDRRDDLQQLMETTRVRWKFQDKGASDASSDSLRQSA